MAERNGSRMDGRFQMPTDVVSIIQEALGKIGRGHDFEDVMEVLQFHLITGLDKIYIR